LSARSLPLTQADLKVLSDNGKRSDPRDPLVKRKGNAGWRALFHRRGQLNSAEASVFSTRLREQRPAVFRKKDVKYPETKTGTNSIPPTGHLRMLRLKDCGLWPLPSFS
jgi:hypothetical protein